MEKLAALSGIPKTTLFRTLVQLEEFGYVQREERQGKSMYSLGFIFLDKSQLVKRNINIREMARDEMIRLRNELNLTVQLAIRHNEEAIYVEQFESWRPIRVFPAIGKRAPLYAAACPRLLLAYLPEAERKWLLSRYQYRSFTEKTVVDPKHVEILMREIIENGFSISEGELFEGTTAVAVPLFDSSSGEVLAALSVIGMTQDFQKDPGNYVTILKEAAARISAIYTAPL